VGQVASVGQAESGGQAESAGQVESAGSVELVAGIALPRCRLVVADAATGNTIQHTAVELRIETGRRRTDLEAPRAATPSPTDRPVRGNRLVVRAAISRATAAADEPVQVTGLAVRAVATGLAAAEEPIA